MFQSKVLDHVGAFGVGNEGITCRQRLLLATSPPLTLSWKTSNKLFTFSSRILFCFFLSRKFPCFIHQKKSFCSLSGIIWAAYVTGACITAHCISVAASSPFFHHSPQRMPFMRAPVKWKKLGTFLATEFRLIPLIGVFGYFGYQLDQNHDAKKSQYKGKSKMFGPWSDPNNPPY